VEAQAFRLLLGHTSARNFLAYERDLRVKKAPLDQPLHRPEVINRGTWGEVRFSCEER